MKLQLDVTDIPIERLNNLCVVKGYEIEIGRDNVTIDLFEVKNESDT